jgi:fatty-acyl-CoA synthase
MTTRRNENTGSALKAWVRALERTAPITQQPTRTLPVVIDELADQFESSPALLSQDTVLSYRALSQATRRYARWALGRGLRSGDVVGLLMRNCPHYMAIWLGLTRAGVTVALLNTHLQGEQLAHSIRIVAARYVIFGSDVGDVLRTARGHIDADIQCWSHGADDGEHPRLDQAIDEFSGANLTAPECPMPSIEDRALYIYTSGTTGLPKAAHVSHFRLMQWSHWFAGLMDTQPSDRMYDCLPLYHSVGGVVATGATLVGGGAVVLRERFSVRDFWQDVTEQHCTLFQYIGELCRYLLNGPPHADETRHGLRVCCGNGLRSEVWEPFQHRFQIPQILEYYAATEGSFSLYNCEGRVGAIGRIPPFLSHRLPVALVQYDPEAGAPARDGSGFCLRCAPNEVGEALGEVIDVNGAPSGRFEGYTDEQASQQKILRNVFVVGDAWYRTGDLMRQDEQGFFYFVDRVGDTYRWKGENVSTTEVAGMLSAAPGVADAVVYGVAVPKTDGRAGMGALMVTDAFDLAAFRRYLAARSPEYARPLFLRLVGTIELTGTFKLNKQALAREGYDPASVTDTLYFDDRRSQSYVQLNTALYERIQSGSIAL